MLPPGVNFISKVMSGYFTQKTKKLIVFENEFHHALLYENCDGYVVRKSHLAVLVAICKSQLVVYKKALKKRKNIDKNGPWLQKLATDLSLFKKHHYLVKSCI
jgi:hypothetical protein